MKPILPHIKDNQIKRNFNGYMCLLNIPEIRLYINVYIAYHPNSQHLRHFLHYFVHNNRTVHCQTFADFANPILWYHDHSIHN